MASSEKQNIHILSGAHDTAVIVPTDLPPSYETTILPNANPWTDTPSSQTHLPLQPSQSPTPTATQQNRRKPPLLRAQSSNVSIPSQAPLSALSRLSKISFSKYRLPDSKLSDDHTTLTTTSADLTTMSTTTRANSNPSNTLQQSLITMLLEQASLPPKPVMLVRGTHVGTGAQTGQTVVDFELKFNLTSLLDLTPPDCSGTAPPSDGDGSVDRTATIPTVSSSTTIKVKPYHHTSGSGSGTSPPKATTTTINLSDQSLSILALWVRKFVDDKAENRSFTLERSCPALPTTLLEGYMRTVVASTNYRGTVSVEFPVLFSRVVVQRKSSNWFTNLLRLYPTKKYEVLDVQWGMGRECDWKVKKARRRGSARSAASQQEQEGQGQGEGEEGTTTTTKDTSIPSSHTQPQPQPNATTPDAIVHSSSSSASSSSSSSSTSTSTSTSAPPPPPPVLPTLIAQAWCREWHSTIVQAVLGGKKGWVTVEDWIEAQMGVGVGVGAKEWGK